MIPQEILLGPITIHLYGLIIAFSIFLGWFLAKKRAHLYKQSLRSSSGQGSTAGLKIPQTIFDDPILLVPLILAIFGARIYHVLDFRDYYFANPSQIISVWRGGLGIWGALAGAILGFFIIAKIKKLDFLKILDLVSPSLLLGQTLGRIGNFINQEGFGPPTKMPWGVYIDQVNRPVKYISSTRFHPTFFYEAALDAIFLIVLLYLVKKLKYRGQVFALYLIFYSAGRFIIEFWRIDTWVMGDIKVAHVVAILVFLLGIGLFGSLGKKGERRLT